jgi:uncharacterized protein (UPF0335 family)
MSFLDGDDSDTPRETIGGNAAQALKAYAERVERINEEIAALMADRKEIFAEAKGNGFDTKTLRHCIKLRAMDADKLAEQQALIETYAAALGITL